MLAALTPEMRAGFKSSTYLRLISLSWLFLLTYLRSTYDSEPYSIICIVRSEPV